MTETTCNISILAGKAFSFTLSFVSDDNEIISKVITVKSF